MDPPLTDAQRLYLAAFDEFLAAQMYGERRAARDLMAVRLNYMLAESNLSLPDGTRWRDSRSRGGLTRMSARMEVRLRGRRDAA